MTEDTGLLDWMDRSTIEIPTIALLLRISRRFAFSDYDEKETELIEREKTSQNCMAFDFF